MCAATMITVLETERLRLREMVPADLDFVATMLADPEVTYYYERRFNRDEANVWPDGRSMMNVPVAEKPADNTPRGRLRALYDWVTGATPSPHPSRKLAITPPPEGVPARIGRYAITSKLGEGG